MKLVLLLASFVNAAEYSPIPVEDDDIMNVNLRSIDEEIVRTDLTRGGTVYINDFVLLEGDVNLDAGGITIRTSGQGVTFSDGTTLTGSISSTTIIPEFTTSQTSFNVAMASVTIAASGDFPIRIELAGCSRAGGNPTQAFVTFYEDAVPVAPWTSTNGVTQNVARATSDIFNFSFSLVIRAPSEGDVIYSALHRTDGTEWIWQNDADCVGSFTASEVH